MLFVRTPPVLIAAEWKGSEVGPRVNPEVATR
jgi:hypothetical protein